MIIRRINPLSVGKIAGVLYAVIGFIMGVIVALAGMIGFAGSAVNSDSTAGMVPGMLLGVGAVVFLPLLYGALGFVMTAFMAWLYNLIAGVVGGIEIDTEQPPLSR